MEAFNTLVILGSAVSVSSLIVLVFQMYVIAEIVKVIKHIENQQKSATEAHVIEFQTIIGGHLRKVKHMFQKVTEPKTYVLSIADRLGNPAKVDGSPKWASSDESLVELAPSEDGMSCLVTPKGPIGTCQLQALADADLGEGVKEILGVLDLEMIAGDAEVVTISAAP